MHRTLMALALSALTPAVAAAAPTGRVTSGWPILSVGADAIHVGGDGGPVVIDWSDTPSVIGAYTPTAATRWGQGAIWGCGNCPGFFHDPAPRAPFGQIGPNSALYSDTGAIVQRTAPAGVWAGPGTGSTTKVTRTLSGQPNPLWEITLPYPFDDRWDSGDPVFLVTAATVFITPSGYRTSGDEDTLVALNLATGAIRWQRPNTIVKAVVDGGVLVQESDGSWLVLNEDGTVRAELPLPTPAETYLEAVSVAYDRVYFRDSIARRVYAADTSSGQVVWSTPTTLNARLLSVEPNGTVLLAFRIGARYGIHAMTPAGVRLWAVRTLDEVSAARMLPGGTVAFSTGFRTGLVWRVNPKVPQLVPATFGISLSRDRFRAIPTTGRATDWRIVMGKDRGTIITLRSPSARTMAMREIQTTATGQRQIGRWRRIEVPAGRSATRVDFWDTGTVRIQFRRGTTGPIVFDKTVTVTS